MIQILPNPTYQTDSEAKKDIARCPYGNPDAKGRLDWLHKVLDVGMGFAKHEGIPEGLIEGTVACTVHGLMHEFVELENNHNELKAALSPITQVEVNPDLPKDTEMMVRLTIAQIEAIQKLAK